MVQLLRGGLPEIFALMCVRAYGHTLMLYGLSMGGWTEAFNLVAEAQSRRRRLGAEATRLNASVHPPVLNLYYGPSVSEKKEKYRKREKIM